MKVSGIRIACKELGHYPDHRQWGFGNRCRQQGGVSRAFIPCLRDALELGKVVGRSGPLPPLSLPLLPQLYSA